MGSVDEYLKMIGDFLVIGCLRMYIFLFIFMMLLFSGMMLFLMLLYYMCMFLSGYVYDVVIVVIAIYVQFFGDTAPAL